MATLLVFSCSKCLVEKPLTCDFFRPDTRFRRGYRPDCKACVSERQRANYRRNAEYRREQVREYNRANRDLIKERRASYRLKNLEAERQRGRDRYQSEKPKVRERLNRRRRDDPKFRIREMVSSKFRQFVNGKPQGGFQSIVGYTVAELYTHLERQFLPGMSWENYGSHWEIDHILPVSSYDLPGEIVDCWALSNLRPLERSSNRRKSNIRLYLL